MNIDHKKRQINVTRSSMPPYEEYCAEIKSIWNTVHLTNMGPIHNRLKEQVKAYLKADKLEFFCQWSSCFILHAESLWGKG